MRDVDLKTGQEEVLTILLDSKSNSTTKTGYTLQAPAQGGKREQQKPDVVKEIHKVRWQRKGE